MRYLCTYLIYIWYFGELGLHTVCTRVGRSRSGQYMIKKTLYDFYDAAKKFASDIEKIIAGVHIYSVD